MKNQGNDVGKASVEDSPKACGKTCEGTVNCNSFAFCNEPEGFTNCYPKDKILNDNEELKPPSNCASYKKIGNYS